VRELRNLVERLVILAREETIDVDDVDDALPAGIRSHEPESETVAEGGRPLREILEEYERRVIERALQRHGGTMAAAARELGVERSHLYKKVRSLGVRRSTRDDGGPEEDG
jgi:DNA-binding NtrC family response regulator